MIYSIEEIKQKAIPVAEEFGIDSLSLFGSYARGEANDESDLDFYIDSGELDSLIKYYSFINRLKTVFGCHVDVVSTGINDKSFIKKIKNEGVLLYERRR